MYSAAEKYFLFVNGALAVLGIAIIAYSAYLASEFGELQEAIGNYTILVPLVFGSGLLLTGFIGCCAAKKHIKILQILYFVLAVAGLLVTLGMGVAVLTIGGELDRIEGGEDIEGDVMSEITDAQVVLFNTCCAIQAGIPEFDTLCNATTTNFCITDVKDVEFWEDFFTEKSCEVLEKVELDGVPIVGNITEDADACGGGNFQTFSEAISSYIADNLNAFGGVILGLSIALLLLVLSSCCLIFRSKTEAEKKQQVKAGNVAN